MSDAPLWRHPEATKEDLARAVRVGNRLQKIARLIEKELEKVGATKDNTQFSLIIWGPGRMQYASNAERSDVKKAMEEMIAKWGRDADLGKPSMPLGGLHEGG